MRHIASLDQAKLTQPSAVTIGAFDGIHRGHQYLFREFADFASRSNLLPVVLTFFPHPEMVLRGYRPGFYLTLPDVKARLLGELGIELVVTHPFDDKVRQLRAAQFVEQLRGHLKMAALWVGADFAMGFEREGNVEFLTRSGHEHGFDVRALDLMDAEGEQVSSSRIREALALGEVREAARLLGRDYSLPGEVVQGAGRGRTIGIPTANLSIPEEQAVPARGVYAAWATLMDGRREPAVVNIGFRPTFDGGGVQVVEVHLLQFSGDLYGQTIEVAFTDRLREERKFDGVEALVAQIHHDIEEARTRLG